MIDNRKEYPGEPQEADVWLMYNDVLWAYGDEWLLKKYFKRIFEVYLVNKNRHVHLCSFDPSYEAVFIETGYELVDDDISYDTHPELIDELEDALRLNDADARRVEYFNVRGFRESAWIEQAGTFTHESEAEYWEKMDDIEEGYRGNPIW